jgi:hypothetical protein
MYFVYVQILFKEGINELSSIPWFVPLRGQPRNCPPILKKGEVVRRTRIVHPLGKEREVGGVKSKVFIRSKGEKGWRENKYVLNHSKEEEGWHACK